MKTVEIEIKHGFHPNQDQLFELYNANKWSSAKKLDQLEKAIQNSHFVVTAFHGEKLIGLANAISDGHLVVYFPHLLVHPKYQKRGIGKQLMQVMLDKYQDFHQKMIVADDNAVDFYESVGFAKAKNTTSMWIYTGGDH